MTRLLILILALGLLVGCGEQTLKVFEKKPMAPELKLNLLHEGPFDLSEWQGKPVIVNFWASWCPPCREEIPSMNRAWDILKTQGVQMVGVNHGESTDTVKRFLKHSPIEFPVAVDYGERSAKRWPVRGLPMTFIVDTQGRVVYSATGPREWDDPELLQKITALTQ